MAETLCNNKLEATSKQTLPVPWGCYILVFAGGLIDFLLVNLKDKGTVAPPTFVVQLVGVWGTDLNVVDELLVDGGFWVDADFGISEGVDFTAISFIKNPEFIKCLKNYLKAQAPDSSFYLHQGIFSANKALSLGSQASMFIIGPEPMTCPLETGVTLDQLNIPMVLKAPLLMVCGPLVCRSIGIFAELKPLNDLIAWNTLSTCPIRQWWQQENLGPNLS